MGELGVGKMPNRMRKYVLMSSIFRFQIHFLMAVNAQTLRHSLYYELELTTHECT